MKTKKKNTKKKTTPVSEPKTKDVPQRLTQGYSTMDGQPASGAWFNVTNWH